MDSHHIKILYVLGDNKSLCLSDCFLPQRKYFADDEIFLSSVGLQWNYTGIDNGDYFSNIVQYKKSKEVPKCTGLFLLD